MIYKKSITTPANTAENAPIRTVLKMGNGVIHKMDIVFPPGCQQLVHVQIKRAVHQLFPTNAEESFNSDGETISFRTHHPLRAEPYQVEIITWNNDDTHNHTILVRLGLLRKNILTPWLISWREKFASAEDV